MDNKEQEMKTKSNTITLGDCLDKMKELPDNSVDSVVTDPPYGLSSSNISNDIRNIVNRGFNIMLPYFDKINTKSINYFDFVGIFRDGSNLRGFQTINCIESWVSMPECTINFDSYFEFWDKEVNTSAESTCDGVSDWVLMDKLKKINSKYIGNYILDFGDSIDFPRGNTISGDFGQFIDGFFCVPISAIQSSFSPNILSDFPSPFYTNRVDNNIRISNNPQSETFCSTLIHTSRGAKDSLMLRFDSSDISIKRFATITTIDSNRIGNFCSPKLIRTNLTTSGLSAKLEPTLVSFITNSTDGAYNFYHLVLWLPYKLNTNIQNKINNSKGFMGSKWDYSVPSVEIWKEVLRVLKPGGHLLAACGTRTQHRMAVNIEDAGFEIRDCICYAYGTGFPKSLNIGKQVDLLQGNEREVTFIETLNKCRNSGDGVYGADRRTEITHTKGNSEWEGWGSGLKPAIEIFTLARKPLSESTIAKNVLRWGTGAINIDACRIKSIQPPRIKNAGTVTDTFFKGKQLQNYAAHELGRFPANIIHDGSDDVLECFPDSFSSGGDGSGFSESNDFLGTGKNQVNTGRHGLGFGDSGNASRFFYCAKASRAERDEGLDSKNKHVTVKPISLMRYLCRLITPTNGLVLEPFAGSGTTCIAAIVEGFSFIAFEREPEYHAIASARIAYYIDRIGLLDESNADKTETIKNQLKLF